MTYLLSQEQKSMAFRLQAAGLPILEISRQISCTDRMVRIMVRERRLTTAPPHDWAPRQGRLTIDDRERILIGLHAGDSLAAIARQLGRPTSTVSREVARNGGRAEYRAWGAHQRAREQTRRPKTCKLTQGPLLAAVTDGLIALWSPQAIGKRLRSDFPDSPEMWVSHETIYQSLFVQGRGELRRELARCLRSGRAARRPHGPATGVGQIPGMINISDRPAEAADRSVPGHWEGDLIIGKNGRSAIGTLVERSTRFVLLLHLNGDRTAENVQLAMQEAIATLPEALKRSITWDQGKEMSRHAAFTSATGIPIYFCDPHSPWQRGSNENTNGLLRQYLPKGTDLSKVTSEQLQAIADSLNGRPRATLDYRTPAEELSRIVALTL